MTDIEQRIVYLESLVATLDAAIRNLKLQLANLAQAQRTSGGGGGGGDGTPEDPAAGITYFSANIDVLNAGGNTIANVWTLNAGVEVPFLDDATIFNDTAVNLPAGQVMLGRNKDGTFAVITEVCPAT